MSDYIYVRTKLDSVYDGILENLNSTEIAGFVLELLKLDEDAAKLVLGDLMEQFEVNNATD